MTVLTAARPAARVAPTCEQTGWTRRDIAFALGWMLLAIALRAPLVARIESILDHDQSIVGLMALDIAAGTRWPIFFDGQRYMGAVEPYVAALFVRLIGHSASTVALSPLLFFSLFTAAQYTLWKTWLGRSTGHVAALVTILGAPMFALWSIVPRGGYIELLAWALPTLAVYRWVTRPDRPPLNGLAQFGWGFLFALGYFLNPLSLIVYATLALDWTLGRHGPELRERRGLRAAWLDSSWALVVWLGLGVAFVAALAVCCHIEFHRAGAKSPYVLFLDLLPTRIAGPAGCLGIVGLVGLAGWWSGALVRIRERVASHLSFCSGALLALSPYVLYNVGVASGRLPAGQSLPIWIRAPWQIGRNLRDGRSALGALIGCDPGAPNSVLIGQGVELPEPVWPLLTQGLSWVSPLVVAIVLGLLAARAWSDRRAWSRFWSLQGKEPSPPTVLALLMLGVCAALYLLQATSPNASSVRYLVPTWIVLPGLIASGLQCLPRRVGAVAAILLVGTWSTEQVNLWADMDRPSPLHPLAARLESRGIDGIVAETPVALMVANLSHGRVGACEFRSKWPRLWDRYRGRFPDGRPVVCVDDTRLSWSPGEGGQVETAASLGRWIDEVSRSRPESLRLLETLGPFKIWQVHLPLAEIVGTDDPPLSPPPRSAKLGSASHAR